MFVTRLNQKKIFKAFQNPFITQILGPRRVGKSSLVQHYLDSESLPNLVSLNLDEFESRLQVDSGKLRELIEQKLKKQLQDFTEKFCLVVDEAQKSESLFEQVKILYDRYKDTGRFKCILTGSASLPLAHYAAESLAGRIFSYELLPFSLEENYRLRHGERSLPRPFSELLQGRDLGKVMDLVFALQPLRGELQESAKEQWVWGGFPELLKIAQESDRKIYLSNYRQTYLEKDVRSLEQVGDLAKFNQLLELLAYQVGSLRQDKRLYDALSISPQTLSKYLSILSATFLYEELPPYIATPFKRLSKAKKSYLFDNGLLSYLRGIYDVSILEASDAIGAWFENWAVSNLKAIASSIFVEPRGYYYKTSGNVEVDLVLKLENWVLPIEIKYTQKPDSKKVKHLKRFLQDEPRAEFGVMLYNGPCEYNERDKILYFPAWCLL